MLLYHPAAIRRDCCALAGRDTYVSAEFSGVKKSFYPSPQKSHALRIDAPIAG
jgi:hypothetical protein